MTADIEARAVSELIRIAVEAHKLSANATGSVIEATDSLCFPCGQGHVYRIAAAQLGQRIAQAHLDFEQIVRAWQ